MQRDSSHGLSYTCAEAIVCTIVEQQLVQILVVVANIQMRCLKTEEEKVSM